MKRVLILLLSFLLLTGCYPKEETENIDYAKNLYKFEPRQKTNNNDENKEFNDFIDKYFFNMLEEAEFVVFTSFVDNPENFGLKEKTGVITPCEYGFDQEEYDEMVSYLNELATFDYDSLSSFQQYTYESIEYSLYESLIYLENYQYELLFSKRNDVIASLFFTLADIDLNSEERIVSYLQTVESIDEYFQSLVDYTKKQYEDNIYTSDNALDYSIEMIQSVLNDGEDNILISTFNDRIEKTAFLNQESKEKYIKENRELVMKELFPYLEKMIDDIGTLKGQKQTNVSETPNEYRDILYTINSGSNIEIGKLLEMLIETYNTILEKAQKELESDNCLKRLEQYASDPFFKLSEEEMIEKLQVLIKDYYPEIPNITYSINNFNKALQSTNTMAYYRSHTIDNPDNNIIMVNPSTKAQSEGYAYGGIIAHEGVPGHMYIKNYFSTNGLDKVSSMLSYIAYDEGMAMYACYLLPYLLGYGDIANILSVENICPYLYDSIMDIMINYYDYDKEYMMNNFNIEEEYIDYIFEYYQNYPAVQLRYGAGFAQIYKYLMNVSEAYGDKFNIVEFNELLLSDGPLPYVLLDQKVNEYIINQKED